MEALAGIPIVRNIFRRIPRDLKINPDHILSQNGINRMHHTKNDENKKSKKLDQLCILFCCACVILYHEQNVRKNTEEKFTEISCMTKSLN